MKYRVLLLVSLLWVSGCTSTVTPDKVKDNVHSFDEGTANSGFIGFAEDGCGIITTHAKNRYNALIKLYGVRFLVPLKEDDGISPDGKYWKISPQALVNFQVMNSWYKERR